MSKKKNHIMLVRGIVMNDSPRISSATGSDSHAASLVAETAAVTASASAWY